MIKISIYSNKERINKIEILYEDLQGKYISVMKK